MTELEIIQEEKRTCRNCDCFDIETGYCTYQMGEANPDSKRACFWKHPREVKKEKKIERVWLRTCDNPFCENKIRGTTIFENIPCGLELEFCNHKCKIDFIFKLQKGEILIEPKQLEENKQ